MAKHSFIIRNASGVFERLALACPACSLPLYRSFGKTGEVFVYCPHGRCPSQACNNGITARDIETARAMLAIKFDRELAGREEEYLATCPTSPNFENTIEAFLMRD